jgi:para-aminobenzoate synthetase/4-amino-4-deoxychorismate lyase
MVNENWNPDQESGTVIARRGDHWLIFRDPIEAVEAKSVSDVRAALSAVEDAISKGFWAAGFVSYEAAPAFDDALLTREPGDFPLLWFGIYDRIERMGSLAELPDGAGSDLRWNPTVSREQHHAAVESIHEAIARGDTYQVNFTHRLRADFAGSAWGLFRALCRSQEARYAAFVNTGRHVLCSASPELFFDLSGTEIVCRPMKGTLGRGRSSMEDRQRRRQLQESAKDRAENVMIVDMVRNDLSRMAVPGSVIVPKLFEVEQYYTLFQMTSSVTAETIAPLGEIFAALFPCASITGAPKVSTMRIIAEIETTPRGIYTGCIGFAGPERQAQFNVAIRTVHVDRERNLAEYGTGGGIVWDSKPAEEFEETRTKTAILFTPRPDFDLLETMLWLPASGYFLLGEHLNRLCDSADYFGLKVDPERIFGQLLEHAAALGPHRHKVRLLVAADGSARIESAPLDSERKRRWTVQLAADPVMTNDRFLYHKTTQRQVYESARATRPDCDDVLLWNEAGEITESTVANVVLQMDGRLVTPPIRSGLLGGIYRAHLLQSGRIEEAVIHKNELFRAERIYLINSVRGWIPVDLQ